MNYCSNCGSHEVGLVGVRGAHRGRCETCGSVGPVAEHVTGAMAMWDARNPMTPQARAHSRLRMADAISGLLIVAIVLLGVMMLVAKFS